jgi:hypothetical protein
MRRILLLPASLLLCALLFCCSDKKDDAKSPAASATGKEILPLCVGNELEEMQGKNCRVRRFKMDPAYSPESLLFYKGQRPSKPFKLNKYTPAQSDSILKKRAEEKPFVCDTIFDSAGRVLCRVQ